MPNWLIALLAWSALALGPGGLLVARWFARANAPHPQPGPARALRGDVRS